MKFFLFFCLLVNKLYCGTVKKQYFDPTKFAISSVTFLNANYLTTKMIDLQYYNHTLPRTMTDASYTLLIGISELDVSQKCCRILVTRYQSQMFIQLVQYPSALIYKCSFMFFASDSQVTQISGSYNAMIDNSTIGEEDLNRLGLILNATFYHMPKQKQGITVYNQVAVMVQYFYSSNSSINFQVSGWLRNSTHVTINLGNNHNLQKISISFIHIKQWDLFYLKINSFSFNTNTSWMWNDKPTSLALIGLKSFKGSYPIKLQYSDAFPETIFFIPFLTQTLVMIRIQSLPEKCPIGSEELNATTCKTLPRFFNISETHCYPCDFTCYTCTSNSPSSCLTCNTLDNRQWINNQCPCIFGYHNFQYKHTCKKCPQKCINCTNQTSCLTCIPNNHIASPNTLCVCIPGFTEQSSTNQTCIPCNSICKTCSKLPSNCTSCKDSVVWFLDNGQCLCIPGYFNPGTEVCQKCSYLCLTCASDLICLSCNSSQFRVLVNQTCVCQNGYYFQPNTTNCSPCSNLCLTCSDFTVCLSCDSSKYEQLSGNSCVCEAGYYNGSGVCQACTNTCLTCSSVSACLSCSHDDKRILVNSTCICPQGYFEELDNSVCKTCPPICLTCVNNSNCISCNATQSRFLKGSDCICLAGYYELVGTQACYRCIQPCQTCSSNQSCLSCKKENYYLQKGECIPIKTFPTIRNYRQNLNQISIIINFPVKISFLQDASVLLSIYVDDEPTQIQIEQTDAKFIIFRFNLTKPSQKLTASFKNGSLMDANTNAILFYDVLSLDLQPVYYYGDLEGELLTTVGAVIEKASEFVTYSRLGGMVFRLVNFFLDLIEYIHQISFYVFLDCDLPSNLRKVFSTLYNALQYNILPISVSVPGADYDGFDQPEVYSKEGFSFNFLANCFLLVVQLCVSTLIYIAIGKLFASVKSKSAFVKFFRGNFSRTIYSNCVDALSASQLPLCFASAVTLIDRNFNHPLKVVNFACGVVFAFLASFIALINPLFLYSVKHCRKIDTQCSYGQIQRHSKYSQLYLFSKALIKFSVSVFVPLLPAKMSISLLLIVCFIHIWFSTLACFKSRFHRFLRLTYSFCNILSHTLLVVLILPWSLPLQTLVGIGYAIVFLLLFNMFIDAIGILEKLVNVCLELFKCCFSKPASVLKKKSKHIQKSQQNSQHKDIIFSLNSNDDNFQSINGAHYFPRKIELKSNANSKQISFNQKLCKNRAIHLRKMAILKKLAGHNINACPILNS